MYRYSQLSPSARLQSLYRRTSSSPRRQRSYTTEYVSTNVPQDVLIKLRPAVTWQDAISEISRYSGLSGPEAASVLSPYWDQANDRGLNDLERYQFAILNAQQYIRTNLFGSHMSEEDAYY